VADAAKARAKADELRAQAQNLPSDADGRDKTPNTGVVNDFC
jgi:hypothetical protein